MDSAGGAREGVRVENRTDAIQRIDLDAGGASTTRRLDPGGVFVWREAPRGGFDLQVNTDDDRSVTTVPRGTEPSDVTVVVARDGVSVDLPGGTVTDAFATGTDTTDTTGSSDTSDTSGATDAFGTDADEWGDDGDDDPWTGGGSTPDRRDRGSTESDRGRTGSAADTSRDSTGMSSRESTGASSRESRGTSSRESTTEASSAGSPTTDEPARERSTGPSNDTGDTDETERTGGRRPDETTPADDGAGAAGDAPTGTDSTTGADSTTGTDDATDTDSTTGTDDATNTDSTTGTDDATDTATPEPTADTRTGTDETATSPQTAGAAATPAAADTPSPAETRAAFAETVRVDERLDELEGRAVWLDQEFRIPGTNIRIGVSSIVGVLPGAGDGAMFLVALSLVYHGLRLGASTWTLMKMSFILFVEFAVSVVPVVGDFVGAYWSANVQNVGYLRAERESLDGSTNWVFVLILFSPSILTFLAVVSLL